MPYIYSLYFWLLRCRLFIHSFLFLATLTPFVIVVSLFTLFLAALLQFIYSLYLWLLRCRLFYIYSLVISDAWVHAYINVQNICTLIRRAGRKSQLCRQKFAQDFSFKIHLFLQNVLQNLVLCTSKSITFGCFYFIFKELVLVFLSIFGGYHFRISSGFIGIYFYLSQ